MRATQDFADAQARLRTLPPAPTTAEAARVAANRPRETPAARGLQPAQPSSRFVTFRAGTLFQISVPENWRQLPGSRSVTFAPDNGYATANEQTAFSHGIEAGEVAASTGDVRAATDALVVSLAQANPGLQRASDYQPTDVGDRRGLKIDLTNGSGVSGKPERISLYSAILPDGHLFYVLAVAPSDEFASYAPAFSKSVASLRLAGHH